MADKFKVGDKVTFKASYDGYFADLIGKTLTVQAYILKDESVSDDKLILVEIEEAHLVSVSRFELI